MRIGEIDKFIKHFNETLTGLKHSEFLQTIAVTYFFGIPLVIKITRFSVTGRLVCLVGAEGPKSFEFNTSTSLEKALKALPSHFKCGGPEFGRRCRIHGIKILLDASLYGVL